MSVLAIDLGGTRIKLGVVDQGRVVASEMLPAHSDRGLAQALPRIAAGFDGLLRHGSSARPPRAVVMGFPGLVDRYRGKVLSANKTKYDDAPGLDLSAWARHTWNLPLHLENDARLMGIGEWRLGAGRGCDNLALMGLGTGIGVCVISEGRVLRGPHGQAGILGGHLSLDPRGPVCTCGNRGCAEAHASGHVIDALARRDPRWSGSALSKLPRVEYHAVFAAAAAGDALAVDLADQALAVWSAVAVNLIHAYDLERIIIGGGIMGSAGQILPAVRAWVDRHAWTPWGKVEVRPAALQERACLLAAEWLADEGRTGDAS